MDLSSTPTYTSQEICSSSNQESRTVKREEFCEHERTILSPILLTLTSHCAKSPSRNNYRTADDTKTPPVNFDFQQCVDSVEEKAVNEIAREASCETNRGKLNLVEDATMAQLADAASCDTNRKEVNLVEDAEETIAPLADAAICETNRKELNLVEDAEETIAPLADVAISETNRKELVEDAEETTASLADAARCQTNTKESNLVEDTEDTIAQSADAAICENIREQLSCIEQKETLDQLVNEASCEIQTDINDPAMYIHCIEKLGLATKRRLILQGAFQPKVHEMNEKQFPKSRCGSHHRSFNESWYHIKVGKNSFRRKWLSYSPKKDAVFCHFCIFFGRSNREQTFTKIGYRDWKKANEKLAKHEKSQCHINATVDFTHFSSRISVKEQLSNEASKVETTRKEKIKKNREVIKRLIDVTLCLAQQGMAFRGHSEVDEPPLFAEEEVLDETCTGNFRSLVNLLAKYDAPLANHLRAVRNFKLKRKRQPIGKTKKKKSRSGRGNLVSFMSADSQNKIINKAYSGT